jgi:thioesterase domain-containing protein
VLRAGAPRRLVHVYGPTETTTFATWHEVTPADAARDTIPIGRPIRGATVHVLDGEGEPAPVGVPGEIHIGGAGVSRRYAASNGGRYATGDRARVRADGAIEFLGRVDRQVKLRGHRIELDEVQAALTGLPYVRDAVVQLRGATSDTRRIVAWIVPLDASLPPPTGLRRDLRRRLPEAMLPSATVWVPSLPLTANGKVDLRALPEPGLAPQATADGRPAPPRDMLEGILVSLWEDLLGRRGIGIHDRFFEIGGHSLLAARLVDAIERTTGLAVPLTALFADDTIDGLARALRDGAPPDGPIVEVNARGTRAPFVFLHGDFQAGGFYSRALARALGPDQPTLIVHPHGLAGDAVPDSIEAMAADRVRDVHARRPAGPYVVGGHCNGALVAFEMARQMVASGDEVLAVVLIEQRAPAPPPREPTAEGPYVKFNERGEPMLLAARDRLSEIELRYTRAIDAYAGGRLAGHAVVVQAEEWRVPAPDAGWARLAATWEGHVVPGGHVTMITRHLDELAGTIREAIGRRARTPGERV